MTHLTEIFEATRASHAAGTLSDFDALAQIETLLDNRDAGSILVDRARRYAAQIVFGKKTKPEHVGSLRRYEIRDMLDDRDTYFDETGTVI